jgi:hypothetical protein
MIGNDIRPTTIVGIKRLANSLHKREGLKHAKALDLASRRAGFTNFRNARASLGSKQKLLYTVFLTAYWREPRSIADGRETLELRLERPWQSVISGKELRASRALSKFRGRASDHLASKAMYRNQDGARQALCFAARELQFMAATGLRPADGRRLLRPKIAVSLPATDHATHWIDPARNIDVIIDEPYVGAIGQEKVARRATWAEQHGYRIEQAPWPGMYAPDIGSLMFVAMHETSSKHFDAILAALESAPEPIVRGQWFGVSAPFRPAFRSPQEQQSGLRAIAPIDPFLCRNTESTRIIGYALDRTIRMPSGKMPIETHEKVGSVLKEILSLCGKREGVRGRVEQVQGTLDSWLQAEYTALELDNERFFDVYYHGPLPLRENISASTRERLLADLLQAQRILRRHYPDCAPLRDVQGRLEGAMKSLRNWRVKQAVR